MANRSEEQYRRAFGALVARKRLSQGIAASELASKIGVTASCLSRIENGSREPRLEIMRRLDGQLDIAENLTNYLKTGKF